jgi:hypothetical protein
MQNSRTFESGCSLEFLHFSVAIDGKGLFFEWKYVSVEMMKQKEILRRRERLARELPSVAEIVRGSLLDRTIRHRQGCPKCARGQGHPVSVLTVGYAGGKNRQISLHAGQREQVERWIKNYQELKNKLEEICELNQQLLRAEE